ncbi:fibronectin type III domain-containing protein [Luminiphilus sp.]|nr:fibronectin type III domain-containing protein [Luminiphilus sp.]
MVKQRNLLRSHSIAWSIAMVGALLPSLAHAAFDPDKTSSVTVSVDGNQVDLALTVTRPADGGGLETVGPEAFGGGDKDGGGVNELSLLRAVKGGGEVRLLAQGGVIETDCADGSTQYYQRARVTLSGLPSAAKDVWALYDPRVGATDNGVNPNVQRGQPHFNAKSGFEDAWPRIADSGDQIKLCDNTTVYVDGTAEVLTLGSGGDARDTAGMKKAIGLNVTTAHFDVYVPMEGRANSTTTGITLAMGFVVDVGQNGALDDATADVAFEAWVSSEPWWNTPPGQGGNETDEFNTLLPICNSPAAEDPACLISTSGIYDADGTTRIVGANDFSAWTTQIGGDDEVFDSIIDLAPTASLDSTGFAIPTESIVHMAISWPTAGSVFGGDLAYGEGAGKIDLLKLAADTPVRVNTAEDNTLTNTWTNVKDGNRVVSTLIGEARAISAAISRETWWPQCDVEFNQAGEVVSDKCGADMTSNVTNDYMVFSSVPARLAVIIEEQVEDVAGGLVSTNGQGFAFGRQTFAETDPAYEFTSSGPSFDSAGARRSADGFYYVCLPATYLDKVHSTTASVAAGSWVGTRKDGDAAAQSLTVTFTEGTCGLNDAGLVASVASFGYSSPVFQLKAAATAPGAPTITGVTVGDGQATVTFTPPASNGGATITKYTVTANPGGITQDCASSPCTVTGLTNGTAYTFTAKATNSAGGGDPSTASDSVTPAPAAAATPVPTLPVALLLLLSLGLFSLVRLKGAPKR